MYTIFPVCQLSCQQAGPGSLVPGQKYLFSDAILIKNYPTIEKEVSHIIQRPNYENFRVQIGFITSCNFFVPLFYGADSRER